jgi:branched-chain amino acid transport system substrate-binding protein
MKQLILLIALICFAPAIAVSETPKPSSDATVGVLLPLTGPFADWGNGILHGIELGTQDSSSLRTTIQDDACDGKQAVSAAQYLLMQSIQIFMVGCVSAAKAIAPIIQKRGGLVFVIGGIDNETLRSNHNVIDFGTGVRTETRYLAAYIKTDPTIKTLAIIQGTNFFGEELTAGLGEGLKDSNVEIISNEKIDILSVECHSVATRILSRKPDAVFAHGSESSSGQCVKELRQLGFKGRIFAPYTTESESFLNAAGSFSEGVEYTFNSNASSQSAEKLAWEERFRARFGTTPIAHSYIAYDAIKLVTESFASCTSINIPCLNNYFKELGEAVGVSGELLLGNDGSANRPFGIKRIKSGKFEWVVERVKEKSA